MILTRVKHGLKSLKAATASQLAADLSLSRADVETALEFWVRRGDVQICAGITGPACGTACTKCPIGRMPTRRATTGTEAKGAGPKAGDRRRPDGFGLTGGGSPVVYEWKSG
jgi:hypothetical protein